MTPDQHRKRLKNLEKGRRKRLARLARKKAKEEVLKREAEQERRAAVPDFFRGLPLLEYTRRRMREIAPEYTVVPHGGEGDSVPLLPTTQGVKLIEQEDSA